MEAHLTFMQELQNNLAMNGPACSDVEAPAQLDTINKLDEMGPLRNSGETLLGDLIDLSAYLVESGRAQACFTQHYYRYSLGRLIDEFTDGCALESLRAKLDTEEASLQNFMRALAELPEFKHRQAQ